VQLVLKNSGRTEYEDAPGSEAIAYVRDHYAARAVETPWQRRFVTRFR
jgi:hypothetical protein